MELVTHIYLAKSMIKDSALDEKIWNLMRKGGKKNLKKQLWTFFSKN